MKMKFLFRRALFVLLSLYCICSLQAQIPASYKGTPYKGTPQVIPGRIEFEFHDDGGMGVALDVDYNAEGPIKTYRPLPHVSVDETNTGVNVDKYFDGKLYPSAENPHSWYAGWTHVGDWTRFTVYVKKTDDYKISSTFAQGEEVKIGFTLKFNGDPAKNKKILLDYGTGGGFHTWKKFDNFTTVHLDSGLNMIEFYADIHHVNYDYLEFTAVNPVDPSVLSLIVVTPATASVANGKSIAFVAVGKDQFGRPMSVNPEWSVSGGGTITTTGIFTAQTEGGPYNIIATSRGISTTAQVLVTPAPILQSIDINPKNAFVKIGQTQQYTAIGKDQYGNDMAITPTWTTSTGTITTTGLLSPTVPRTQMVTATVGAISGTASVNVEEGTIGLQIGGFIQAEAYTGMYGIQTQATTDVSGGLNIGYVDVNDWLDYKVYVIQSGTYDVSIRVASQLATGAFQIKSGANVLASIKVPNTGGWQKWQTLNTSITVAQGDQTIRILATGAGFNINWMDFNITNKIKIQAESYTSMFGIQTETTSDAGGGLNVGWSHPGDYMNYNVNILETGTYTINFRVASQVATGKIELRNQAGATLTTLAQGSTGGWQNWVTKTVTANLAPGPQTLKIYYTGAGLNINWFELVPPSGLKSAEVASEIDNISENKELEVYPNPVSDELHIQNADFNSIVEVYNLQGKLVLTEKIDANNTLNVSRLNPGLYMLKASERSNKVLGKFIKR
jgi:hypothetical protein